MLRNCVKYILLAINLLLIQKRSGAQGAFFQNYTIENGVSAYSMSRCFPMLHDSRGFMWFATTEGLTRFDGLRFTIFRHNPNDPHSLSNNFTNTICEDLDGKIWVGTNQGVSVFDFHTETFTNYQHDSSDSTSLAGNEINFVACDDSGNVWVGTRFSGISCFQRQTKKFKNYVIIPQEYNSKRVQKDGTQFLQQADGTIWIGNTEGLHRYNPNKDSFDYLIPFPEYPAEWKYNLVAGLAEDREGNLWISSGFLPEAKRVINPNSKLVVDFPQPLKSVLAKESVNSFYLDRKGNIWIGTVLGVFKWDPTRQKVTHYQHDKNDSHSILPGMCSTIYEDREGNMWFSFVNSGFSMLHSEVNSFEIFAHFPSSSMLNLDEKRVLISSAEKLHVFDIKEKRIIPNNLPAPLQNAKVEYPMILTPNGKLWVTNFRDRNTYRYSISENVLSKLGQPDHLMTKDRQGNVWAAYNLLKFNPTTNQWESMLNKVQKSKLHALDFKCIATDSMGHILLGTDAFGIYLYDPVSKKLKTAESGLEELKFFKKSMIRTMYVASNGLVYIGSSVGFGIYDPKKKKLAVLDKSDGLPHNMVQAIIEDSTGDIWLATGTGIVRFDPKTKNFENFNSNEGFKANAFMWNVSLRDANGYIYFSSDKDIFRFHPDSLKQKVPVSSLYLSHFYLDRKLVKPSDNTFLQAAINQTKSIELPHNQSDIGFGFIMPSMKNAHKIRYYYQLKGFDKDWQQANLLNEAHYTNLDPGSYTFRVKALTHDGTEALNQASVQIIIHSPWWATWWAYLIYSVAFLGIALNLFSRQRLKHRLELETIKSEKLKEVDQFKTRFFANISHEFRTPLTLILGQIDNLKSTIIDSRQRHKLLVADRNAKRLLELINQLLDLSKLEAQSMTLQAQEGNIVSFLKNVFFSIESLAEQKNIQLSFQSILSQQLAYFDQDKLAKILTNLLSNAWKFTPEGEEIRMHVWKENDHWIAFDVSDTGQGIPAESLPSLFDRFYQVDGSYTRTKGGTGIGLALVKELVELHRGKITVKSELGHGSTFTVKLPLGRDYLNDREIVSPELEFSKQTHLNVPLSELYHSEEQELVPDIREQIEAQHEHASVLIVEDNPEVLAFIAETIQSHHYKPLLARNGREGLETALEMAPDLIITDVMMPEMNGYDLARAIREEITVSHIPIILLTAKTAEEEKLLGLELGVDDYITKPFSPRELLARTQNLIEIRKQLRQHFSQATIIEPSQVSGISMDQAFLKSVLQNIELNLQDGKYGVEQLADSVNMSVNHLNRKLNALIDQSAGKLMRSMRLQKAAELLGQQVGTVSEISDMFGFSDASNFSRSFKKQFGYSPSEYIERVNQV